MVLDTEEAGEVFSMHSVEILKLIGRSEALFVYDMQLYSRELEEAVKQSSFLIIGGGGLNRPISHQRDF